MELWIRSQDKHNLVKVNNLSASFNFDYNVNRYDYTIQEHEYGTVLGYYETKERAFEVLEDIQNTLFVKNMYEQDRELLLKSWENFDKEEIEFLRKKITVYEMPDK